MIVENDGQLILDDPGFCGTEKSLEQVMGAGYGR